MKAILKTVLITITVLSLLSMCACCAVSYILYSYFDSRIDSKLMASGKASRKQNFTDMSFQTE